MTSREHKYRWEKEYYIKNKERILEVQRKYYWNNRDKILKAQKVGRKRLAGSQYKSISKKPELDKCEVCGLLTISTFSCEVCKKDKV